MADLSEYSLIEPNHWPKIGANLSYRNLLLQINELCLGILCKVITERNIKVDGIIML